MSWVLELAVVAVVGFGFASCALAETIRLSEPVAVDGDTIDDRATGVRYRVFGLDAPEIGFARCPKERAAGLAAKRYAEKLIRAARVVEAAPTGRVQPATEKFRERREARVLIDGADFAGLMIGAQHARRSGSGQGWC